MGIGGVRYRIGLWTADKEEESSNFKELKNLVDTIKEEAEASSLINCEFFLFTKNSTVESCFYRGTLKSRQLHGLVLRLRSLEMTYGMTIHVIHVRDKRMIAQGTDGCSRGSLMEGVMRGLDMLLFMNLSHTAIDRHPPLLEWVRSWTENPAWRPSPQKGGSKRVTASLEECWTATKCGCPYMDKKNQIFLWSLQPLVADAALEQLLMAWHKCTDTFHVVLIPQLMTLRWRRLFNKACDFTFIILPGASFWPTDMFESLWVSVVLPFTHHRPWCFKRAPLLVEMGRELCRMLENGEEDVQDLFWKLLKIPGRVAPLSQSMACRVLHVPWRDANLPHNGNQGQDG